VRRTKEQAAETGRNVLQAAEELFLNKGYENVRLEEIATQAGVTRGAVHWHFKNKHGLLLALRDSAQEPFRVLAEELSTSDGAASLKKLGDIISETFRRLENDPRQQGLIRVMITLDLSEKHDAGGAAFPEDVHDTFIRIFEQIDRDLGITAPWTPYKAASMLHATIGGLLMEWALRRGAFQIFPDGALFIRTLLDGLTK